MSTMLVVCIGMASMWTYPKLEFERISTDNFLWNLPLSTSHAYLLLVFQYFWHSLKDLFVESDLSWNLQETSSHRWLRSRIPKGGKSRSLCFWANFHKCVASKNFAIRWNFYTSLYPLLSRSQSNNPACNEEPLLLDVKKAHMFFETSRMGFSRETRWNFSLLARLVTSFGRMCYLDHFFLELNHRREWSEMDPPL